MQDVRAGEGGIVIHDATGRNTGEGIELPPPVAAKTCESSQPAANGLVTVLKRQRTFGRTYFDAAGMPGRTIDLEPSSIAPRHTRISLARFLIVDKLFLIPIKAPAQRRRTVIVRQ